MLEELSTVALTKVLPESGLKSGDVGAIVHNYPTGQAYEVGFVALDGETIAIITLPTDAVRPIRPREIAQAREVA
jgi:hypothetical protein